MPISEVWDVDLSFKETPGFEAMKARSQNRSLPLFALFLFPSTFSALIHHRLESAETPNFDLINLPVPGIEFDG